MPKPRALDSRAEQMLVELVEGGASLTEAAATLRVSYKAVQNAARRLSLKPASRPRPRYGAETRLQAVERYIAGESTGEIARSLGVSDTWVQLQLKAYGIPTRALGKLAGLTERIAREYQQGSSTMDIAEKYGVSDVAVSNRLRLGGHSVRESGWASRKYPIRHDAFSSMSDVRAAYWAGFLMADGCISSAGRITLALADCDVHHIAAWLDFLGCPHRPIQRPLGKARAQVSSRMLTRDLAQHGIVVRKTTAGVPASRELAAKPDFWRGMIDGDGTIMPPRGKHGPSLGLVGSHVVMEQYSEFLARHVLNGYRPKVLRVPDTSVIYQVKIEGVRARMAIQILWPSDCLLQDGANRRRPALTRKLPRVLTALDWESRTEKESKATLHLF